MVQDEGPVGLDAVQVKFDDERIVSDAGLMLLATLAARLQIEELAQRFVRLRPKRPGAGNAGRKVMSLIFAMALGADSIDDCDVLRSGRTRRLLGGWVAAPSTLGTFLRAFTFGHVRQLDRLLGQALTRAWRAGAGPGDGRLVIDVDSFVGEVCGRLKQGAAYGYTKLFGYHPILATRADTREALHIRLRKGSANTQKGMLRFTDELIARVTRAGATGVKLLRADSGFWNTKVFERLERAGWQYSIGVRMIKTVRAAVEAIPEDAWTKIDYPDDGEAQIAETVYGDRRLIVRRTRLLGAQAELWPDWRHSASSPTAPTTSPWLRPSTATTPSSSRSSQTSRTRLWRTSRPGTSTPTARGLCSPRSRTTCCAGPNCSASPALSCAPRAPSAGDCSHSPAASPATHAAGHFIYPPAGPGRATSRPSSRASERFPPPPDALPAAATASRPSRQPGAISAARQHHHATPRSRRDRFTDPTSPPPPPDHPRHPTDDPITPAAAPLRWIEAKPRPAGCSAPRWTPNSSQGDHSFHSASLDWIVGHRWTGSLVMVYGLLFAPL
jgi:hypothetical protein